MRRPVLRAAARALIDRVRLSKRIRAAVLAAPAVGLALMANDLAHDAWWAVTPGQVADAKSSGKPGVELTPGRFVTEPVAADGAGWLPVRWMLGGAAAGFAVLAVTGRHRAQRHRS